LGVLFTMLVFAGVYIGHVGDGAIEARLLERATKAEKELKKLAARDLSPEQRERFGSVLKPFAGQKYRTAITQGIDDGFSFWKTLPQECWFFIMTPGEIPACWLCLGDWR
jgi:hypothetical protein